NESELEAAMAARGYAIVRPETLSVRDQIALFRGAEIIVAQSGAALANVLFCAAGARVLEIQSNGREPVWARDIARLVGADWRAFVEASPLVETEMLMSSDLRPDTAFSWRLDLKALLAFLDPLS
ncbi:glycosyltransferase family 61 protein, partial [Caulobacter sp.]|uniref:glycosyltransferase family 61 protein n=1 Tax=Caulobacter sp. TaxID=78 RepID=UPI002B46622B